MLAFFLTIPNIYKEDLASILQAQALADFDAFTAAFEEFPEEDQTYIQMNTSVFR